MDALATVVAIGLVSFLLLYFSTKLDEKHGLFKLLSLFFVLALAILIPKTILDAETNCEPVVNQTSYNGTTTTYSYTSFCFDTEQNTNETFLKAVMWFYRLFMAYVITYLGYHSLMALKDSYKSRGRK